MGAVVKEDWDPGSAKLRLAALKYISYLCTSTPLHVYFGCYVLGCSALFVWVKYVDIPY